MILTLTPNPCVDKTVFVDAFEPGMRIRGTRCSAIAGGKGNNVSRVLKQLGHETRAMNVLGGPAGDHVAQMLWDDDGVECLSFRVAGMTRTITTVLEEASGRQTAFFDPGPTVTEDEYADLVALFRVQLQEATLVTLNGTVPDSRMVPLYSDCIAIAEEAGIPIILDSHGPEFIAGLNSMPTMVKPNLEEAAEAVGFSLEEEAAQWRAVDWFHAKGVALVVLSRGAEGMLVSRDGERLRVTPPKITEVNPVGSGDALVAGFAVGMLQGWPLERMARYGAGLGAANARSWEIGHVDLELLEDLASRCEIEAR